MSQTLWQAVGKSILEVEGGYVYNEKDPGGETNWGISKRAYPNLDIAKLTKEQALAIYERDYWNMLPRGLPEDYKWFLFDCAVNHGLTRALGWAKQADTVPELVAIRLAFYAGLETFPTFGKGWVRRVSTVLYHIADWQLIEPIPVAVVVLHNIPLAERLSLLFGDMTLRGDYVMRRSPHTDGYRLDVRKL